MSANEIEAGVDPQAIGKFEQNAGRLGSKAGAFHSISPQTRGRAQSALLAPDLFSGLLSLWLFFLLLLYFLFLSLLVPDVVIVGLLWHCGIAVSVAIVDPVSVKS